MTDAVFHNKQETCPLCGSGDINFNGRHDQYQVTFTTSRCEECGFIFMDPPLSPESIASLYTEEYYTGNANYTYYDERSMEQYARHVWKARVKKISSLAPKGNFLDVGCSFGGLLKSAEDRGFTSHGIELSPYAAEYAADRFPQRIHQGTLDDHPFTAEQFSVITMIELIEHLGDPATALRECFQLLQPGGMLLIQTANMAGCQAVSAGHNYHYYMPGHLSYFSARNLEQALLRAGFNRVRFFYPVEFGLLPKLQKSRGTFTSLWDYRHWLRIVWYHLKGKVHTRYWSVTSSMVVCAWK